MPKSPSSPQPLTVEDRSLPPVAVSVTEVLPAALGRYRIEAAGADETFSVGLLYGPSGCGMSSRLKAGLLPCLGEAIASVSVEAAPDETEARLLRGLRKRCAELPADLALDQADLLAELVKGADSQQWAVHWPKLQSHRERAFALMHQELDKTLTPDRQDAPLDSAWTAPDAALVRQIDEAMGMVQERFALCQKQWSTPWRTWRTWKPWRSGQSTCILGRNSSARQCRAAGRILPEMPARRSARKREPGGAGKPHVSNPPAAPGY
jgi:hypothetical protein